jgi:hypothetical protein
LAGGNRQQVGDELPEGAKLVPDEVQQEYDRQHLAVLEKIIDKASSDPAWKQRLLSDPRSALDEAGLGQTIDDLNPDTPIPGKGHRAAPYAPEPVALLLLLLDAPPAVLPWSGPLLMGRRTVTGGPKRGDWLPLDGLVEEAGR